MRMIFILLFIFLWSCSDSSEESSGIALQDASEVTEVEAPSEVLPYFEVDGAYEKNFFNFPFPSDRRLDSRGYVDLSGLPNPSHKDLVEDAKRIGSELRGYSVMAVGWFRFDGPIASKSWHDPISLDNDAEVFLIDVDPKSPAQGQNYPVRAQSLEKDAYTPSDLLGVMAGPGIILAPHRTYAFVVMRRLGDAKGHPLGQAPEISSWLKGQSGGEDYEVLWSVLRAKGIDPLEVSVASIFTTGDEVQALYQLTEWVRRQEHPEIKNLVIDPEDGASHERFCELHGTLEVPVFQKGEVPYNTEGLFEWDGDGHPIEQTRTEIPVVINLPKTPMPEGGYPLILYFHGSGGVSTEVVDLGPKTDAEGEYQKGLGPAHVLAYRGFATAGSAHPLNPERYPEGGKTAYLNLSNLKAFRDTFRQGVIEQRLYLDALLDLKISPEVVQACEGLSLPEGMLHYQLDRQWIMVLGFSMGGMYANMVSAVEPRIHALVPAGAGGHWSRFILETQLYNNIDQMLGLLLNTHVELTPMHPVLYALQMGWEPAEPMVYVPRLSQRPLIDHPVRSIYEPVGFNDQYFPPQIFDEMAVAYGHEQAGEEIWDSMQSALKQIHREGLLNYPVLNNLRSQTKNQKYTGVVVQYLGDGIADPHLIFVQRPEVRYQYSCFFQSFWESETGTVFKAVQDDTAMCSP